ncbi:MAG: single-stranded-DNA-specific exonuclease RecJ [Candidatus Rickettsiella isopodorum]|jgi:single-stranded-DNA-specific exonuclease|nr:single-stranded-DNA-specific exonuclease RecJ [Gammaproteobacteria bacterium]MCH9754298.1 single-stranded-DNA-specific exonuclease RecJ [Gammaproteobacteria bacterium]MDD5162333.1 single-stranded-DNA-specific exonuclease RecJ [Candidatus Rickettsiella isopodorum]MDQ5900234.1 single-stranded-DNA-specific exonuclease [Pseudomonadota bacterium]
MNKTILRRKFNLIEDLNHLHPVLQRVYAARGIQSTEELDYGLQHLLHYQSLTGIEAAAQCLGRAVMEQQRLLIVGDFDSDGATSSALAVSALRHFGAQQVDFLVPNRFEYGYGLTPEIVELALRVKKPDVIVTVDNGISSHEGVIAAKSAGLKVVITDHHLQAASLPAADALVNPQQTGDQFPSKHLAGVGVIFYVMLALRHYLRSQAWFEKTNLTVPNMRQFLDLVALGTVADLVSLDRNNRLLVTQGLQWIKNGKARPGISALLKIAKREVEYLVASDLSFSIAPRLNAAGRLADMSLGIACLLETDHNRAHEFALQLSQLNEERRLIENTMKQEAFIILEKHIEKKPLEKGICLYDSRWHQGVIGLLASRLTDRLHRPTIIFADGHQTNELKGSARSINGLHIRDLLDTLATRHPHLINKFGGHAMAAGLSLKKNSFAEFAKLFQHECEQQLRPDILQATCYTDGELTQQELGLELAELLRYDAGPWGQDFPEPLFEGCFRLLAQRLVGDKHLKMTLAIQEVSSKQIEAIAFNVNLKHWPNHRAEYINARYRLGVNYYQGHKTLQLIVENLEPV